MLWINALRNVCRLHLLLTLDIAGMGKGFGNGHGHENLWEGNVGWEE